MFIPSTPSRTTSVKTSAVTITDFYGADFASGDTNISTSRSPNPENMIRSAPGKVRKRLGYYHVADYAGRVNGHYSLDGVDIIHAGTKLYADGTVVSEAFADAFSVGVYFNKALYILDGNEYWTVYSSDGNIVVEPVANKAYAPRVVINKNPDGTGGYAYEDVNLLSDKWTESFYVSADNASVKTFQLTMAELDDAPVTAKLLQEDGTYTELTESTNFTVERNTGVVTFLEAPGKSPAEGVDNVYITASKDMSEQRTKITKCDVMITYGEYGSGARLFVTGTPEYKNRDFWSALNDPTYFSDLSYSILGEDDSRIVGYSIVGSKIAAHKSGSNGAVYAREGSIVTHEDELGNTVDTFAFKTGNVITGRGAIAPRSFVATDNEPLFLTENGIFALTPSDVTGERYMQSRSFYVNPKLLAEAGLEDAYACVYKDFYFLTVNGKCYLLDLLQKRYQSNEPYSSYQYECFLLTGIPARVMWTEDGVLYFGDAEGHVCAFYTDEDDSASYSDDLTGSDPKAIYCCWETPDIDGKSFYHNKTFRFFAVRLASAIATSVVGLFRYQGIWTEFLKDDGSARYFSWDAVNWEKWSWSSDTTPKALARRLNIRNTDKARFRLENNEINEPFGLEDMAIEFIMFDKYRG